MKITLLILENSTIALQQVIKSDKIKAKIGFRLSTIIDDIDIQLKRLNATKLNIFTKYGEKVENSDQITIKPESKNFEIFKKELNELYNEEVEIETLGITKEDIENVEISVEKLKTINWLFNVNK